MSHAWTFRGLLAVVLWAALAGLPFGWAAQETDVSRQVCRANLQFLGSALGLYLRENNAQLPEKLSQLYTAGYVLEPGVFVCPGSGKPVPSESQIDELTDFAMATGLPPERPVRLVWEKKREQDAGALAFYSDGTIREISAAGGPTVSSLTPGTGSGTGPSGTDGSDHSAAGQAAEAEPNNSRDRASSAAIGEAGTGAIADKGDKDWYRFSVDHQGALGVKFGKVPEALQLAFRVYGEDGKYIGSQVTRGTMPGYGWASAERAGEAVEGVADLPAPGTYYLEVKDRAGARSAEPYEFGLTFRPSADVGELNNKKEDATPIRIGKSVAANILPSRDSDWYSVAIDHQGALGVKFGKVPEALQLAFRVYGEDGKYIGSQVTRGTMPGYGWASAERAGEALEGVADLPVSGTYYLEVKDRAGARSAEPYEFGLTFTPSADVGELNNKKEDATPIRIGKSVAANILPSRDSDWYWLAVGQQGTLALNIGKVPAELQLAFRVYGEDGKYIGSRVTRGTMPGYGWASAERAGEAVEGAVDLPVRGAYYIEVKDRANGRSAEPYELALSFAAAHDDGEPDNSLALATPVALEKPVGAAILPRGDVDWYRLDTDRAGVLGVQIERAPEEVALAFRVYDDKGKYMGPKVSRGKATGHGWVSAQKEGDLAAATIDLPAGGIYYLEIRARTGDARSTETYSFRTTFSPVR